MTTSSSRIVFPATGEVLLETVDLPEVGPNQVLVKTRHTMMSIGTELTALHHRFDERSYWAEYAQYPYFPGYSLVGEVAEVGSDVTELLVGDVVAARIGHASAHIHPARLCTVVPDGIDLRDACWFALAKIALVGARAAKHGLGSSVLVIGAGPVGQMSVRWANAAGATRVVIVDPFRFRLELAQQGGATAGVQATFGAASEQVLEACGGTGPDIVIDATGNAEVFAEALRIVAYRGRVVVLGNTGMPAEQRLTDDVINRGLHIVGAHNALTMMSPDWDGDRGLHEMFFDLVKSSRFDLRGLVTHTFDAAAAADAYREVDERHGEMVGVCLDWES